ncbi:hypothetical protein KKI24_23900 [bacterium]|nr:hypothetical protein [bacterium]
MSIDIAIRNVGEYYAAHYLNDKNGFLKDISDQTKSWKEQGSQATPRKLQSLGEAYFKAKARALDYKDPELRYHTGDESLESWHPNLLHALGYLAEPLKIELQSEKTLLPALLRLYRNNQPWLVVIETCFCLSGGDSEEEALETRVMGEVSKSDEWPLFQGEWELAVATLFKQEDRPRWVIIVGGSLIYLFDAHTYAQARYININLDEAFGRKDSKTFEAIAALLSKETLSPKTESDSVIHEKLREGSLKSTHGVSTQLQGAVREAIESIANGWVSARIAKKYGYRWLDKGKEKALPDGSWEVTAEQLQHEALVYVYRILFCLYAEARGGELGILPISDDVYRVGYSVEALRDLAERGEPGTQTESGTYYAEHLDRLFQLIHRGFHPEKDTKSYGIGKNGDDHWAVEEASVQLSIFEKEQDTQLSFSSDQEKPSEETDPDYLKTFIIQPLTATLFDPDATPLLSREKLPNQILHKVIRCLSLGRGEKGKQIGRINYAELGIVQLGAVYEGLLSYKGFFAKEDLIQVLQAHKKNKGGQPVVLDNDIDPKQPTWFVPKSRLADFKQGEVVIEHRTKQTRIYKTGEFILHLNGMDRVNSASYYTPEVLTHTLVREALKERLKEFGPDQADEILKLKICEPAMGSAAFLVEAINQLAHEYLRLKQEQLQLIGKKGIDPSRYEDELRRVQHYIAVHNVYGVDLNPTALELGALSLWLASIHRLKVKLGNEGRSDIYSPGATPWFGLRLRAGNSLIGARRAVWTEGQLRTGKFYGKNQEAPRQLKPGEDRKPNEIYHFLVWDEDMTPAARDKLMKQFWKEDCDKINTWQKEQVKQKWTVEEIALAKTISEKVDELWEEYAIARVDGLKKTQCTASVWPQLPDLSKGASLVQQEQIKATLEVTSGAFQRLKLMMDSWCAFYFWPLDQSNSLPTRDAWLISTRLLLGGVEWTDDTTKDMLKFKLGNSFNIESLYQESQNNLPDTAQLVEAVPWYQVGSQTTQKQYFHHWELIFSEILGPSFKDQLYPPKGFDLMFGNPPWVGADWKEAELLTEYEPLLGVREAKAANINNRKSKILEISTQREDYHNYFISSHGRAIFLSDITLYPSLKGMRTNLYKNFIERSWALFSEQGIVGFLHPESVFDDPKGGLFRERYFKRMRRHYQFKNELLLFSDVGNRMAYSINIFGSLMQSVSFRSVFNLFSPNTISACMISNKSSIVPGIKTDEGVWETKGHFDRIIQITNKELALFASLFEEKNTPELQTSLPQIHSNALLMVLEKFSTVKNRLYNLKNEYYVETEMFNEVRGQHAGLITREDNPSFKPKSIEEWILSGPHFYVCNPFNKTPFETITSQRAYDLIDLTQIPEDYLPNAAYRPGDKNGDCTKYNQSIAEWPKPKKPYKKETYWEPGFYPIVENEIAAWETLLGEPLIIHSIDTEQPGAHTARQFGFFCEWEGKIEEAVSWLKANNCIKNDEFDQKFRILKLIQGAPNREQYRLLPIPITARFKYAFRAMCQPANERTLVGSLMPKGAGAINSVRFIIFNDPFLLLSFSAFAGSIIADFFIKLFFNSC